MASIDSRIQKAISKGKWSAFVGLSVQKAGGACEVCGAEVEFSPDIHARGAKGCVHHRSSDRWDVMVVCPACHRKMHQ